MKLTTDMYLGNPDFNNAIFMLDVVPTTATKHLFATSEGLTPEPMDEVAWFLPAFLNPAYNLFFILAPNVGARWAISCSQVQIEGENQVVKMSETVPTGMGLNAVNMVDPTAAITLVNYLTTMETRGVGRLVLPPELS